MRPLLFIQLNEINFDYLRAYAERGMLPTFQAFLARYGYCETLSEQEYRHLEPWIQWVTAHSGLNFAEHGIFRLGDIVGSGVPQIWERLEALGYRVGAVCPMNAECRVADPAFFVPDPWTRTEVKAPAAVRRLHAAIVQVVNDNAQARIAARSALAIGLSSLRTMRPSAVSEYASLIARAVRRPWARAMFLDLLLADLFTDFVAQTRPDFASLFLNAGAHIQHHYMFSSACYDGPNRNPSWYVDPSEDPVLEIYRLYDRVLARLQRRFPRARIMLATGLHQDPYSHPLFYWRLKNHSEFLRRIGVPFREVEPRMSRDFVVRCASPDEAQDAAARLALAVADDGIALFTIDNRGTDLFVELTYAKDISGDAGFRVGNVRYKALRNSVAFVAIKNGGHNGIGYFADSGTRLAPSDRMPLALLPQRIEEALAATKAEVAA